MILSKTTVSVVIPTYNRSKSLRRTLYALASQSYDPALMEVVVADTGSSDDTAEIIRCTELPYRLVYLPIIKKFRSDSPVARNAAGAKATGELLVFVDDDEFVRPHFVAEHVFCHQHDRHSLVAGGVFHLLNQVPRPEEVAQGLGYEAIEGGLAPWQAGMVEFCGNLRACRYPWSYCFGGNYSLRKEDLLSVGGVDEEFAARDLEGHDTEFAYRCYLAGLRVIFTRNALAYHDWGASPKENYEERTRRVINGFCYVTEKHGTGDFRDYALFRAETYESQLRALLRCSKNQIFPILDRSDAITWMDQIMTSSRPTLSILILSFSGRERLIDILLALDDQDEDRTKFEVLVYDFSAQRNSGSPRKGEESDVMVQMLGVEYSLRYFPSGLSELEQTIVNRLLPSTGPEQFSAERIRQLGAGLVNERLQQFRSVRTLSDSLSRIGWYYATLHGGSLGSRLRGYFVRLIDDHESIDRSFVRNCMALTGTEAR